METASHYIDTHSHLAMLKHGTTEEILARAAAAGVSHMICVATDEPSWSANRTLALAHSNLYYTLGLHPHDAVQWPDCGSRLKDHLPPANQKHKLVAIGELGLDFYYEFAPHEAQITALEAQLAVAKQYDLPVVIHCRDAFDALYASIRRVGMSARTGVMHCFTGSAQNARDALALGLKISFSGILTFKNAEDLRETAKIIPEGDLLIETDCPFLAPMPFRGKPNEPSYLPHTAEVLARCRGVSVSEIARSTSRNAVDFFRL